MPRPLHLSKEQIDKADAIARHNSPHRPWCKECKVKHDADQLNAVGLCASCQRAVESRAAAAQRRAEAGETEAPPPPPVQRKSRAKGTPSKRGSNLKRYSHDDIIRLYKEEGKTSYQISKILGCHQKTAVNALKKAGIYNGASEGKGGRPLSDFCDRGHDQEVWRRPARKGGDGGWHCGKCKLERNAESKRRATEKKFDNRLERVPDSSYPVWQVWIEGELRGAIQGEGVVELLDAKLRELSSPRRR